MEFQIFNKEWNPITMSQLDFEAAQLWGKEVHPKQFATPLTRKEGISFKEIFEFERGNLNWYDYLGLRIAVEEIYNWNMLRDSILEPFISEGIEREDVLADEYISKMFDLIYLWESKGYTPKGKAD